MKKLILVFMAFYGLNARAQVHESKNFIYLNSDSVIHAEQIRLRPDFTGSWQLRADSRKIRSEKVKFFSNEDGFFANTRRFNYGITKFSERIIEGKINVFQEVTYDPFTYGWRHRYRQRANLQPFVDVRMFYNTGFGDLKKVNYNNLKVDMADNAESIGFLKSYKRSMNTGTVLYVAAGASMVAGLVSFMTKAGSKREFANNIHGGANPSFGRSPGFTVSFVLLGIGVGTALGGYAVQASGSRHLENAIDAYNR